jgi:hypothetical protein
MGRETKPQGKVTIKWSSKFAYAIGLITTDGCLSSDKRHISLVSKDKEQIDNFIGCLGLTNSIGNHNVGSINPALRVQFGDVLFFRFLVSIGLTPHKSKTLRGITVPNKYFFDFLRGHFDGDGTFYSYWDPRWRSSFMFYTEFLSASEKHIIWLRKTIDSFLHIHGHLNKSKRVGSVFQLKYAKKESLKLLKRMYYNKNVICLKRKKDKIAKALEVNSRAGAVTVARPA